jgi:hypothetical protein
LLEHRSGQQLVRRAPISFFAVKRLFLLGPSSIGHSPYFYGGNGTASGAMGRFNQQKVRVTRIEFHALMTFQTKY